MHIANRVSVANSLLAALPRKECRHLIDGLEQVALTYGEVLYEPGQQIRHVYFPNDSVVSLLTLVDQHQALEVGLVGREGMVGIPLALAIGISPVRALVQGTGTAMRMKAAPFLKELRQSHALQRELLRYTYSLMAQITQTAACNRFHVIEARLARWLLMTHDRMQASPFRLTQEFLSQMLGVRRVGVTKAARTLQQNKLISYSRGNITILDRKGLEAASCSCYEIVKDMHDDAWARQSRRHSPSLVPSAISSANSVSIDVNEATRRLRQAQLSRTQGAQAQPGDRAIGASAGVFNEHYWQRQEKLQRELAGAERRSRETRPPR